MSILDFLFPKHCLGCGKTGVYFCPRCLASIKRVPQICPGCERASPFGQTHPLCTTRYTLDGLVSLFAYGGIIREAIHKLKYRYVTDLTKEFLTLIFRELANRQKELLLLSRFCQESKPTIIPIPLFWYKENERGFNQASLFGKKLANELNLQFSDKILVRTKNVPSQTKLTQKERKENVKGIFSVSPIVHSSSFSILLVDDVWTTGATLKEATRVLKEGGVKKVWGLTMAR